MVYVDLMGSCSLTYFFYVHVSLVYVFHNVFIVNEMNVSMHSVMCQTLFRQEELSKWDMAVVLSLEHGAVIDHEAWMLQLLDQHNFYHQEKRTLNFQGLFDIRTPFLMVSDILGCTCDSSRCCYLSTYPAWCLFSATPTGLFYLLVYFEVELTDSLW